jgi:hypothetical protein
MARAQAKPGRLGTYRDGVGVERCRLCLQEVAECYCNRPYWCTWCWETDGTKFTPSEPRCCTLCLQLGRRRREWPIGPPPEEEPGA